MKYFAVQFTARGSPMTFPSSVSPTPWTRAGRREGDFVVLTVIFGAGASYDSVPHLPPQKSDDKGARLLLGDSLFDDRPLFADAMNCDDQTEPSKIH